MGTLRTIGVDSKEVYSLFRALDLGGNSCVNMDEFVIGVMRLRHGAKLPDLAAWLQERRLAQEMHELTRAIRSETMRSESNRSGERSVVVEIDEETVMDAESDQ